MDANQNQHEDEFRNEYNKRDNSVSSKKVAEERNAGECSLVTIHGGWPFIIGITLTVIGIGLSVLLADSSDDKAFYPILGSIIGCFALGIVLLTFRRGITINKQKNILVKWWGILGYKKLKEFNATHINHIQISSYIRTIYIQYVPVKYTYFRVAIEIEDKPFVFKEFQKHIKARHHARHLANKANLGTCDITGGTPVIREAGTLDMSLKERIQILGEKLEYPTPLDDIKTEIHTSGNEVTLTLPQLGFSGQMIFGIIATVCLALAPIIAISALYYAEGPSESSADTFGMIFGFSLIATWIIFWSLYTKHIWLQAKRRDRVTVSPNELTLTIKKVFGQKQIRMTSDEIEEIEIMQKNSNTENTLNDTTIDVWSKGQTLSFGNSVTKLELEWIRNLLIYILASKKQ